MRGIVIGTVLSLILWTFLAWCTVCACTRLDDTSLSTPFTGLIASFACINIAAIVAAIWVWQEALEIEIDDAFDFDPIAAD